MESFILYRQSRNKIIQLVNWNNVLVLRVIRRMSVKFSATLKVLLLWSRKNVTQSPPPETSLSGRHSPEKTVVLSPLTSVLHPEAGGQLTAAIGPAVTLAPSGVYGRRAPFYVDTEEATASTRATVARYFKVLRQQHQSVRMVCLAEALITGQGGLVTRNGHLIKESVVEFTAQSRAPGGFKAMGNGEYSLPSRVDFEVEEACLLVKRPWYANFGHWLVDGATVLALAAETIQAKKLSIVIGRYQSVKMRALVMDTIQQLAPGAKVLEHQDAEIWRFRELYYVTPPHVPPLFKLPEALGRVRTAFTGTLDNIEPRRRLFLTRRSAATRHIVNEAELFELCAARGFELTEPERLPLIEQAKLFAEAAMIIGPKGAALTNCMFCAPGAKTMVLSPSDFPDPFFWDVCAQTGDYGEIFGPTVTKRPAGLNAFSIKPARLKAMLDAAGA